MTLEISEDGNRTYRYDLDGEYAFAPILSKATRDAESDEFSRIRMHGRANPSWVSIATNRIELHHDFLDCSGRYDRFSARAIY